MIRTIIPIISSLFRLSVPFSRLSVSRCRDFGRDYQYFRKVVAVRPKPCGARLVRVRAREMSWKPVQYPSHTPSTLGGGRGMIQSDQRRKRRARQADDRRQRRAPTRKPGGRKDLPQLGVDRGIRCLVGHGRSCGRAGYHAARDTAPTAMPGPSRMRGQRTRTLRCGPCDRRRGTPSSSSSIHPSGYRWAL